MTKPKIKPMKAWTGVVDGKLDDWGDGVPVLFKTRKSARDYYTAVIRVEIRPVEKRK